MYATVWGVLLSICQAVSSRPNIVIFIADDLGFNDVSWHNSKVMMPNLEELAKSGIILEQHYSQPSCTPSRGALLTGRYPVNIDLNTGVIKPQVPYGLPTKYPTMADKMQNAGYSTHAVGKWHLGFCNKKYLPTSRGFDHHFGFWLGAQDYFTHTRNHGYDLRSDLDTVREDNNTYSSHLFANKAVRIIAGHKKSNKPLFLYFAFQSVHTPLQVPADYQTLYSHVQCTKRRKFLGMVTAMDDAVGEVVKALKSGGMLENTVIVFMSDNGGPIDQGADNHPLRGSKGSLWEGGTRTPAFISGNTLTPRTETRMFHITDWLPTLMDLAGIKSNNERFDGVSHWTSLMVNSSLWNRKEMLYNVNKNRAAMRIGDWKYVLPQKALYHLKSDPEENRNVAKQNVDVVQKIKAKLATYSKSLSRTHYPQIQPKGHPKHWNGTWTYGWC